MSGKKESKNPEEMYKEIELEQPLEIQVLDSIVCSVSEDLRAPLTIIGYRICRSKPKTNFMDFSGTFKKGSLEVKLDATNVPNKPYEVKELVLQQNTGNPVFLERIANAIGKCISNYYKTGKI